MSEENGAAKSEEPTPLEAKIIRQVEYYFGDNNFSRDKFIQEKIKEDDGWITMEVMLNFKRLASLSSDKDVILAALRKSTSGLMEIGEDKIRRNPDKPIPENYDAIKDQCKDRVVYVKGFPEDATLDDVMEFMNKFGQTEYINMRRMPKDKKFKGSIFCTFEKEEDAKKFLAEESVKYGETEVIKSSKDAYFERKNEERKKAKEAQIQAKKDKVEADESQILKDRYTKGAILHLKNLPTDTNRTELKEQLNKIEPVHWVDYEDGETEAKIRFTTENGAVRGWEKAQASGEDGKFKIGDNEIEGRVLEGTEEEEHWQDLIKQWRGAKDRKREGGGGRRGGRGGGRGGRGGRGGGRGGSKRSAPSSDDGPSAAKQAKTE
jgi:lupus La protein